MKIFQIGFNKCGTKFITELFRLNGVLGAHWVNGRLAQNIFYSKNSGAVPLQPWKHITLFSDMECVHKSELPLIEAFKDFQYLDHTFADAKFILNTRNVEDWIVSRYMHQDGAYAKFHARALGVPLSHLADIWLDDWTTHLDNCRKYFVGRKNFIEINIDEFSQNDYRNALSQWTPIKNVPPLPDESIMKKRTSYYAKLLDRLNDDKI